jgi:acyl-[acyl-carrier-protein]-phospholipid O-acyltransferase / long-chain-fatty-acid--[acyl-carrier-protein] ligase
MFIKFIFIKTIIEKSLRIFLKLYFRFFHNIKIYGQENIPKELKKLIVISNHASLLDGLIIWTFLELDFKILVDRLTAQKPFLKLFMNNNYTVKIDSMNPYALKEIIEKVNNGQPLLVFPEGRISTTGSIMKIYEGTGFIAYKTGANILPIYLKNTYSTKFSTRKNGTKLFAPITMIIGKLQNPINVSNFPHIKQKKESVKIIYKILTDLCYESHNFPTTLGREFIKICKENKNRIAFKDATQKEVSYKNALISSFALGNHFLKYKDKNIGILLPNLTVTVLIFMGLQLFKKVPAFLNYSSGINALKQAMEIGDLRVIITSKQFLEKIKLDEKDFEGKELVYIENLKNEISFRDKIKAFIQSKFSKKFLTFSQGDEKETAIILFTSGSEGIPKGVCLSHENIISNIYQTMAKIDIRDTDFILNALPIFHSFGLTIGTLMPIFANAKVFLYVSPLHYRVVPEIAYDQNCTIMLGTNTFLNGFAKKAHPYDFYSMRYIFCGAEALSESVFEKYSKIYGIRVLSGYGATECSPVISINNAIENEHGSVGKILPGIEYKLVAVEGVDNKNGRVGRLYVRGKNVMKGYLKNEKANQKYLVEDAGWYDTGDIVEFTAEGFLKIVGRMKRFAKISGEMISLTAVEDAMQNQFGERKEIALTTTLDEKKGEKIILIANHSSIEISFVREILKNKGFSELACPREIIYVKEIPKLGTGKVDYVKLKELI